jgi:hypothetical protein
MRTIARSAVLAAVSLCATAAFAVSRAVVDIPFSFVSQGQTFPAGKYIATLDLNHNVLALNNATETRLSARWTAGPADCDPNDEKLILKFDNLGNTHMLSTIQLGSRITPRLDARSRHHDAGSIEAELGGQ